MLNHLGLSGYLSSVDLKFHPQIAEENRLIRIYHFSWLHLTTPTSSLTAFSAGSLGDNTYRRTAQARNFSAGNTTLPASGSASSITPPAHTGLESRSSSATEINPICPTTDSAETRTGESNLNSKPRTNQGLSEVRTSDSARSTAMTTSEVPQLAIIYLTQRAPRPKLQPDRPAAPKCQHQWRREIRQICPLPETALGAALRSGIVPAGPRGGC